MAAKNISIELFIATNPNVSTAPGLAVLPLIR